MHCIYSSVSQTMHISTLVCYVISLCAPPKILLLNLKCVLMTKISTSSIVKWCCFTFMDCFLKIIEDNSHTDVHACRVINLVQSSSWTPWKRCCLPWELPKVWLLELSHLYLLGNVERAHEGIFSIFLCCY